MLLKKSYKLKMKMDSLEDMAENNHEGTNSENSRYKCDSCDRVYQLKRSLYRHERMNHQNLKRYFCDKCDYSCFENGKLENHKNSKHAIEERMKGK